MKILLNPSALFVMIWSITLLLFGLRFSYILEPIVYETIVMVVLSMAAFILPFFLYLLVVKKPRLYPYFDIYRFSYQLTINNISTRCNALAWIWGLFSIVEVFQAGNFPLLSLFGLGPYVNYVDFGIGGVHGLLNAIYLFLSCYYFLRYKVDRKRVHLFFLIILVLWPILLTTRQLFLSVFLQLLFAHMLTSKIDLKKVLKIFLVFFVVFLAFGYLGDIRSGREHIIMLASPTFEYPDYLPSAFIWIYIYIVSPINNINHNISDIAPLYFPYHTVVSLFPSVLREGAMSFISAQSYNFKLANEAFNVSSFYMPFLLDFGYILLAFVLFVLSSISIIVMHKSSKNILYVFILCIMLHSITLSVFANFLTHIVFVFQMIIPIFIFRIRMSSAQR